MIKYQPRPKGVYAKQHNTQTNGHIRARNLRKLLPESESRPSFPQWPLPGDEEMI